MKLRCGDIVVVRLNPTEGSEQQGANRPSKQAGNPGLQVGRECDMLL